jgi:carbamoyl-phosphate synthase large subunit
MRRKSVESSISLLTSLDTAQALLECLKSHRTIEDIDMVDIKEI